MFMSELLVLFLSSVGFPEKIMLILLSIAGLFSSTVQGHGFGVVFVFRLVFYSLNLCTAFFCFCFCFVF